MARPVPVASQSLPAFRQHDWFAQLVQDEETRRYPAGTQYKSGFAVSEMSDFRRRAKPP